MAEATLRQRILKSLLPGMIVAWLASGALVYVNIQHKTDAVFDAALAQTGRVMLAFLIHEKAEGLNDTPLPVSRLDAISHQPYEVAIRLAAWDASGRRLIHCPKTPDFSRFAEEEGYRDAIVANEGWRLYSLNDPETGILIRAAHRLRDRERIIAGLVLSSAWPLLVVLPLMVFLVQRATRTGLAPLQSIARHLKARPATLLSPLEVGEVPVEIRPLTEALDNMLGRVESAIRREHRFTADAAHELRTPLSVLRVQAQVALSAPDQEGRDRALKQIVAGVDRANHLVGQLLSLARADSWNTQRPSLQELDLAELTHALVTDISALAVPRAQEMGFDRPEGPCPVKGDREALTMLVSNLCTNAVRHTPRGSRIEVSVIREPGRVLLRVDDSGPGIPSGEREQALTRFHRGDRAEEGSGLGLSIVARVAELHGAQMELEDAPLGGLRVTVSLPAARPSTDRSADTD